MINTSSNLGKYRKSINDIETNYLLKNAKGNNITQQQNSTSNYTTLINWKSDNVTYLKYNPQIGQHNSAIGGETGIGTGESGAIIILPYSTDTSPWNGSVGLYVGKDTLKLDGKNVLTSADGTINCTIVKSASLSTTASTPLVEASITSSNATTQDSVLKAGRQDGNGLNAILGANGGTMIVAGEGACQLKSDLSLAGVAENIVLAADSSIVMRLNCQNGYSSGTSLTFTKDTAIITSTYKSGSSWYRVWSDGWIEQGAVYALSADTSTTVITLNKTFSNTDYFATVQSNWSGSTGGGWDYVHTKTTSNFKIVANKGNIMWYACGY